MTTIIQATFSFAPERLDEVGEAIREFGLSGFVEGDGSGDVEGFETRGVVTCYLNSTAEVTALHRVLEAKLGARGESDAIDLVRTIDLDDDWLDRWKEDWKPIRIRDSLVICPAWMSYSARAGEKILKLDTTSAFGTGSHETTYLCLELVHEMLSSDPNKSVLDVGCGSGILAIAARLLGSRHVLGIDIDPEAVLTAKQNAVANNLPADIFSLDRLSEIETRFDIVCANIVSSVLVSEWQNLLKALSPDGVLILSGILAEEESSCLKSVAITPTRRVERGQWIALLVSRR